MWELNTAGRLGRFEGSFETSGHQLKMTPVAFNFPSMFRYSDAGRVGEELSLTRVGQEEGVKEVWQVEGYDTRLGF